MQPTKTLRGRLWFRDRRKPTRNERFSWTNTRNQIDLRIRGVVIGSLCLNKQGRWSLSLPIDKPAQAITEQDPCKWAWAVWGESFATTEDAIAYIKQNKDEILSMVSQHYLY